ncbi:MAG TPA: winged helix-turn-helix transcriptional regulator [Polyangiaceae bacterium]
MHDVLDVLGDPWSLRILHAVACGVDRFQSLVESLEVPRATLAGRLKALVADECLATLGYAKNRSTYVLTPKGADAIGAIALLRQWTAKRDLAGPTLRHRCGAVASLEAVCADCGRPLVASEITTLDFPTHPKAKAEALPPVPSYRRARSVLGDKPTSFDAEDCIGDRWASLVIGAMLFGLRRFGEIEEAIGIAPNILSARLDLMIHAGIVDSRNERYALTKRGADLFPAIMALTTWGERWLAPKRKKAPTWALLHVPCARWLRTEVICKPCGEPFREEEET